MDCQECLLELDFVRLAELAATPEEEAILDELPAVTVEDLLERLRPRIASALKAREHDRSVRATPAP